jgi:hypothetical protein
VTLIFGFGCGYGCGCGCGFCWVCHRFHFDETFCFFFKKMRENKFSEFISFK